MAAFHDVCLSWLLYRQLKVHFDTPGNPQVESLNQLAVGMTRRKAALLFYQTCGIDHLLICSSLVKSQLSFRSSAVKR